MQTMYSNATVFWNEYEISMRNSLVSQCFELVKASWSSVNPAIKYFQVETPILTPENILSSHVSAGFPMLKTERGFLRPETTAGTISAFHAMYPMESQRKKVLPICVWQVGKSFRNETNPESMRVSRLRLLEFYQLEFQLFASSGTKTDYLSIALTSLINMYGGEIVKVPQNDMPHYSEKTLDWEIENVEVAGCSQRTDWKEGMLFEVSIGLDRLMRHLTKRAADWLDSPEKLASLAQAANR